jgi:hypothetical protein
LNGKLKWNSNRSWRGPISGGEMAAKFSNYKKEGHKILLSSSSIVSTLSKGLLSAFHFRRSSSSKIETLPL